jgi:hypothetical protein
MPAKICHYPHVPRESKFQSAANFTFQDRVLIVINGTSVKKVFRNFDKHGVSSAKRSTNAAENIRSEARAADWISQGKRAEDASDRLMGGQPIAFHAHADVPAEKVLNRPATSPSLVSGQKPVIAQMTQVEFVNVGALKGFVESDQIPGITASIV